MSRGLKAPFLQYEGSKQKDKHIRLTNDMMNSKSYLKLSYTSKVLYSYIKLWACGKVEFEYSWSLAKNIIGSSATYIKAKNELIKYGFISCIRSSKCSRLPNKYKFTSEWVNK